MVNKCRIGGLVAAVGVFFVFPALASAHVLAVSVGPSQCVSPLNGEYSATVTITETAFGGTTENIPVGQNVHQLSSSTDHGNTGLNQNYFTQGAVGTQTGPASFSQPTSFTSPSSGAAATQKFTVTTTVPERYVLANSYMSSPATGTITAPSSGCTPPPPPPPTVSVTATTQCTAALDGTFSATIDVSASAAFAVPAGTSTGTAGLSYANPTVSGIPSSFGAGSTIFTITGLNQKTVYTIGAPGGNTASVTLTVPASGCTPPPPSCPTGTTLTNGKCVPPTSCPSGTTLTNGKCVPPTSCPTGTTMTNGQCVPPSGCPTGTTMTNGQCVPPSGCPTGTTMTNGQCEPPSTCPTGATLSGGACTYPTVVPPPQAYPTVCRASSEGYKVRAGQQDTIGVTVTNNGSGVAGAKVRVTLPGGKVLTGTTNKNGKATFTVRPNRSGTILVRSASCTGMAKVKVFAAKAATAQKAPSFTG
jgi:hypothetical protein